MQLLFKDVYSNYLYLINCFKLKYPPELYSPLQAGHVCSTGTVPTGNILHARACYMQFLTEYMHIVTCVLLWLTTCMLHVTCRDLGRLLHAGFSHANMMPAP